MEIDIEELTRDFPYELGKNMKYLETLDHGAFGTVIKVVDLTYNRDIAVKVINKSMKSHSEIEKMKKEISILRILNHPNIVKFYGYMETNNQLMIKMEYIKYGSLKQWMNNRKIISEEEASIILKRILSAIEYLHSKQICHRDIKPANIMLSMENDLNSIKIIDFGLSAQNFDKLINNDYCGTYLFMAPELIEKKLYFISVDIWSIGILMFMLLNKGKHPFYIKGDKLSDVAEKIKIGKINFYEKISPMAKHLISKLLEPNPSWRYTASQAIKHPWITRNINDIPPLTFNEILTKSNNKKIMRDLFNTCLFLNFFSKKEHPKFLMNKRYINRCNYLSERKQIKLIKRREKCLDVITFDEEETDTINDQDTFREEIIYRTIKKKEKCYSVSKRYSGKPILINKKLRFSLDKGIDNLSKAKGSNKLINILKKYQSDKIVHKNFKFNNERTSIINVPKINMKKNNIIPIYKLRNSNSLKNLTSNKNNTINVTKKINEETTNEKNYEECKIKPMKLFYPGKNPQIFSYLSNKKIENIPRKRKLKPLNLFKTNRVNSLNNLENYNYFSLILPNLGILGKRKESKETIRTKSFKKKFQILE